MPVSGDVYIQRTKADILAFLQAEMQATYGEDIDLTESSAFQTFAEAIAALDADQLEPAIAEVFDSAYLDSAEGDNLEKVVAILGIARRAAAHATGTIEFSSDDTVTATHTILEGQTVQTDSDSPVVFNTTEEVALYLRDNFESGTLSSSYAGDTGNFSVVDGTAGGDPTPTEGGFELKSDGTADVKIFDDTVTTYIGHTMDFYMYVPSTAEGSVLFGVQNTDNYYEVVIDDADSELRLERVDAGSTTILTTTGSVSVAGGWVRVQVEWLPDSNGTIRASIYDGGSFESLVDTAAVAGENVYTQGGYGFRAVSADSIFWDHAADRAVLADARCSEGGTVGNIGGNVLTVTPSTPAGVDSVSNPYAMGNSDRYLTSLDNYTTGLAEETDDELRDRAQESEGALGAGTVPAIIAALREVPGVESITLFENDTNATVGGLPPVSAEAVVYGTHTDQDVAEALFEVYGFTAQPASGVNGSAVTENVEAENGQTFTMEWSEPTEININMTLDLVVDDTYIGDDEIRDRVVEYIGGIDSGGASVLGTGVGEDVYVNQIEDAIVGPDDTGVIGIDTSGTSYTPTTTTDANGLEIIDIGSGEVAKTNGQDGSITINTTTA